MLKKVLFLFLFISFGLLFAQAIDSVKVDGQYIQITYLRTCTNQDTLNFFWEEYLKDTQGSQDYNIDYEYNQSIKYCINKYLRKYGISRLMVNNKGIYEISMSVIEPYLKQYFKKDLPDNRKLFISTNAKLNQDYLKSMRINYKFSHLEFWTEDVVKAYFIFPFEQTNYDSLCNVFYLKKIGNNHYYFLTTRQTNKKNNKTSITTKTDSLNDKIEKSDHYVSIARNAVSYDIGDNWMIFEKYEPVISIISKRDLTLVDNMEIDQDVLPEDGFTFKCFMNNLACYESNKYYLDCNLTTREHSLRKKPFYITKMYANGENQTFCNFPLSITNDGKFWLVKNQAGLFLYNTISNEEIKIALHKDLDCDYWNISFTKDEEKVFFTEGGDHFTGYSWLYDIKTSQLNKMPDAFYLDYDPVNNEFYAIRSEPIIITHTDKGYYQNSPQEFNFVVYSKGLNETVIPIKGSADLVEYYDFFTNIDFICFVTSNDHEKFIYLFNKKSKKLNLVKQRIGYCYVMSLLPDGRLILSFENETVITKPEITQ